MNSFENSVHAMRVRHENEREALRIRQQDEINALEREKDKVNLVMILADHFSDRPSAKIQVIKILRNALGWDLRASKDFVDKYWDSSRF